MPRLMPSDLTILDSISTLVVLVIGDSNQYATHANALMRELQYFAERDSANSPIIIVFDGAPWYEALSNETKKIKHASDIVMPRATNHPGKLANAALARVNTVAFTIVTFGSEISTCFANRDALLSCLDRAASTLTTSPINIAAGYRGQGEARTLANESYLVHPDDQFSSAYPYAWLQMLDLVPMSNTMVRTDFCRALGGFTEARAIQRRWWWEFTQRASLVSPIQSLSLQPVPMPSWHHFHFAEDMSASVDENLHAMMRVLAEPYRQAPIRNDEYVDATTPTDAANAVKAQHWPALPFDLRGKLLAKVAQLGRPLRIAVLGGMNEPAHNQLCFFNYFSLLRDAHVLTWRSFLDERASMDELANYDLVIFSRVRSAHGAALISACAAKKIRTLYMLDDNWFWLGREWDEYAELFMPGKPDYEHFVHCVRQADTSLTYSDLLADDLRPYAKSLMVLPTNINLSLFPARKLKPKPGITIGYVGSLRKNMRAFDALVEVMRERDEVQLFIMSNALPPEFAGIDIDPKRICFEAYQFNYAGYANTVTNAAPDILVAPVGLSRFEASKCPNKFLEITACGAVGVYSRAAPYLLHVGDGETGLFADDSVQSWVSAINQLIDSPVLRQHMLRQASATVQSEYSTVAVLPRFVETLLRALG